MEIGIPERFNRIDEPAGLLLVCRLARPKNIGEQLPVIRCIAGEIIHHHT